ncbi:MAG: TonB-dependent receptor, partial [Betaproteobacteria bacterium]|nr:TonB-dependent receptor [Betaproteobacteria bacterium]
RALLRPAEVLEYIPGMVVTQHSGDGKANQYFLRGMNLDHGTDFATTVNGVPINMPSHGHGHGYSDLNVLIPELVSRIQYRKGPYFAAEGDFSSAGSASIMYRSQLDKPIAAVSVGQRGYLRAIAAGSREIADGVTLLAAVERLNNDGPWTTPEGLRKANLLFTVSGGTPRENWSTSLSAYSAYWNSTDQVPQRLIDAGSYLGRPFGRFDSLDPSDGARTSRLSLSGNWQRSRDDQITALQWYLIKYDLDLYSNFTYALDRASDQFAQKDHRSVLGANAFRTWISDLGSERSMLNTLGVQVRQDQIRVGLFDTVQRQIEGAVRDDRVRQTILGIYGQNELKWTSWFRTLAGIRADQLQADVTSFVLAENTGSASAFKVSP